MAAVLRQELAGGSTPLWTGALLSASLMRRQTCLSRDRPFIWATSFHSPLARIFSASRRYSASDRSWSFTEEIFVAGAGLSAADDGEPRRYPVNACSMKVGGSPNNCLAPTKSSSCAADNRVAMRQATDKSEREFWKAEASGCNPNAPRNHAMYGFPLK
nr:hypothetical protein SHINE37_100163 [Rhizobiaceae bacterium]